MNRLKEKFEAFGFTEPRALEIAKRFQLRTFKTGELFVQNGILSSELGIIEHGMFQFFYDNDTEEQTTYIALKNDYILSVQCFFAQQPAKENIKALTNSAVWVISKASFDDIVNGVEGFKELYIKMLEQLLVCLDDSRFDYITLKPEERYTKLINEEPELIKQIPLKYLSSLVGVTPRHLSRIRKNIR